MEDMLNLHEKNELAKQGVGVYMLSSLVKYGSLMFGVYAVLKDPIVWGEMALGIVGYGIGSGLQEIGRREYDEFQASLIIKNLKK